MTPNNPNILPHEVNVMAPDSEYKEEPDAESMRTGPIPLDTYPVQWYNFMWNQQTVQHNRVNNALQSVLNELWTVLNAAEIPPDSTLTNQLLRSIKKLIVAKQDDGSETIKSSDASNSVTINNDKTVSVNALQDINTLDGDTLTSAINANTAKLVGIPTTVSDAIDAIDAKINTSITVVGTDLYIDGVDN